MELDHHFEKKVNQSYNRILKGDKMPFFLKRRANKREAKNGYPSPYGLEMHYPKEAITKKEKLKSEDFQVFHSVIPRKESRICPQMIHLERWRDDI